MSTAMFVLIVVSTVVMFAVVVVNLVAATFEMALIVVMAVPVDLVDAGVKGNTLRVSFFFFSFFFLQAHIRLVWAKIQAPTFGFVWAQTRM